MLCVVRGELILGGALTNPVDGAMLFFKVDSARLRQWKTSQRMTHTQKGV
jgi:hypothetical protein